MKLGRNMNVSYQLFDKNGLPKKFYRENVFGGFLRKIGFINNTFQIPFIFGTYGFGMSKSNLITNAGVAAVAGLAGGTGSISIFDNIGVGKGATSALAANTVLATEVNQGGTVGTDHLTATVTRITTDVTNDTLQLVRTFAFTATIAITESGVFNAESGGTMLARQTFSAINVVNGDTLQITWKIDFD